MQQLKSFWNKVTAWWAGSRLAKALQGPQRSKILWATGITAFVLVGGLIAYNSFFGGSRALTVTGDGSYLTEAAAIGTLTDTVSATGSIEAGQQAALNWRTTGIVEEVQVTEGDEVTRGDPLASLQLDSVDDSIITAQYDLEDAKQQLQDFYDSYTGTALAQAKQTLADAQEAYEDALYTYNSVITPANDLTIENAYADVILAELDMRDALQKYKKYNDKPDYNLNRIHTFQLYYDAKSVYDAAVRTYNSLQSTGTDTQIAVAQADVEVAEQSWLDAQAEYDRLLAGPTDEEIAAAEAKVTAAQAVLNQRLIEAPFDGVVTLALPREGNYVESGEKAFEIQNTTSFYMEVLVNEMDINKIEVGEAATVTLDALAEVTYDAVVSKVGSIGDDSSGVVNFTVLVEILEPDEKLRSGMTAVVDIETVAGTEALLIPNQAVRLEDGRQVVYVMDSSGGISPIAITIGNSSSTYSEVLQGNIQPGDQIVLNPPTTVAANNDAGFFLRAIDGGGGGGEPPTGGFPGGGQPPAGGFGGAN